MQPQDQAHDEAARCRRLWIASIDRKKRGVLYKPVHTHMHGVGVDAQKHRGQGL